MSCVEVVRVKFCFRRPWQGSSGCSDRRVFNRTLRSFATGCELSLFGKATFCQHRKEISADELEDQFRSKISTHENGTARIQAQYKFRLPPFECSGRIKFLYYATVTVALLSLCHTLLSGRIVFCSDYYCCPRTANHFRSLHTSRVCLSPPTTIPRQHHPNLLNTQISNASLNALFAVARNFTYIAYDEECYSIFVPSPNIQLIEYKKKNIPFAEEASF